MPMQSEGMSKREESKDKINLTDVVDDGENHQKFEWVTDNREQRKKKKTYAEMLQSGYEKEGTFEVISTIHYSTMQQSTMQP